MCGLLCKRSDCHASSKAGEPRRHLLWGHVAAAEGGKETVVGVCGVTKSVRERVTSGEATEAETSGSWLFKRELVSRRT